MWFAWARTHRNRFRMIVVAAVGYGVVVTALSVLHIPAIAVAVYFVIPTALVAIAGGPIAGGAAAIFSMLLVLGAEKINPGSADATTHWLSSSARLVALLCTGTLVGWFAARNRMLVGELRVGAERDHLTELGNHRFFEAAVDRRLEAGQAFALLLCDMDRLKDVNDGQGHSAGDEALQGLAGHLRALSRSDDEIARIGGDEFCVVAPLRGHAEADAIAIRIETALAVTGGPATFGWATYPVDGRSKHELFKAADERLYLRKVARTTTLRSLSAAG